MAYLAATNVTVDLNPEDIDRSPDGRIGIRTFPTVRYGNGALQYSALGIPMPALGKFGFNFAIKRAYIEQPANGFIYHFDRTNHKLRIFLGSARAAITMANATQTGNVANPAHAHDLLVLANNAGQGTLIDAMGCNVANQALVSAAANAANFAGANSANKGGVQSATPANSTFTGDPHTHTITGGGAVAEAALAEMDDGVAPAATTLYMEMVGR